MSEANIDPKPYVGLDHYKEADAPFFFGRRTDRDLLIENLRASRMTLLYGTSGVGKSSVLHAGVAVQLKRYMRQYLEEYGAPEFAVVIFRDWRDDPLPGLMRATGEAIAEALQLESVEEPPDERKLTEAIKAWTERYDIELLFILDQFEDYFFYHAHETGDGPSTKEFAEGTFARELTRALSAPDVRAKFLVSLRDDALSKFDRFKPHLPSVFNNLFRLQPLDAEAARDAIVEPLKVFSLRHAPGAADENYFDIEPELVDEIIRHLQVAAKDGQGDAGGAVRIETPYLQLVMERLWEIERKKDSRTLQLATLDELKGLENIIQEHVDKILAGFTPEQSAAAAGTLKYLVRPSGDKIAYLASDLVGQTGLPEASVKEVLAKLTDSRILRPVEPPPNRQTESRYEIYHDVLGKPLLNWQTQYTNRVKLAEEERRRWRRRALLAWVLVSLLAFATAGYALIKSAEAAEAEAKATMSAAEASKSAAEATENESEAKKQAARAAVKETEAREALGKLQTILGELQTAKDDLEAALKKEMEATKFAETAAQKVRDALRAETAAKTEANKQLAKANALQEDLNEVFERVRTYMKQQLAAEKDPGERAELEILINDLDCYEARINGDDKCQSDRAEVPQTPGGTPLYPKRWRNGATIHVRFLEGDAATQRKVEEIAKEWTKYGNINLVFDNAPDAPVRITFDRRQGEWSFIGTDVYGPSPDKPTMNLGFSGQGVSEDEFRRSVLRQFGHLLGLVNEHQNPNVKIPWNMQAVYKQFPFSDKDMVNRHVLPLYTGPYRAFDPQSVMVAFPIPSSLLKDDSFKPVLKLNYDLSEGDKRFIAEMYPGRQP